MAFDIEAFYIENELPQEHIFYVASERFIDKKTGEPIPWELKPISAQEDNKLRNSCTERKTDRKTGNYSERFDSTKYSLGLIGHCVVNPDLTNTQLQKNRGVAGVASLLKNLLTAGELNMLIEKCLEVSGLLDDVDDQPQTDFEIDKAIAKKL